MCLPSLLGSSVRSIRRALFARFGFADLQGLPVHVAPVEAGDRGPPFVGAAELEKAESFRIAVRALGDHVRRNGLAVRQREVVELRISNLFGEISHVEFHWSSWPARPAVSLAA